VKALGKAKNISSANESSKGHDDTFVIICIKTRETILNKRQQIGFEQRGPEPITNAVPAEYTAETKNELCWQVLPIKARLIVFSL